MTLALDQNPTPAAAASDKTSLAGLDRVRLGEALRLRGVPEKQVRMRVSAAVELALRARRHLVRRHDRRVEGAARRARRALHARPARDRRRAGVGRRHAQVAAAVAQARPRGARARDRDRLHPRGRSRHAVHLEPGRLHADLLVLPYRHAAPRAQSRSAGDRRPDPAGPRPHRRLAGWHAAVMPRRVPPTTVAAGE